MDNLVVRLLGEQVSVKRDVGSNPTLGVLPSLSNSVARLSRKQESKGVWVQIPVAAFADCITLLARTKTVSYASVL